jgi:dTDP-4-amino-4,6-dideoxygalactose transaminase
MSLLPRIIFTGFAPNITPADIVTVLSYMVLPWRWVHIRTGVYTARAHTALAQYLGVPYVYVCDSGRSALYIALQALGVGKGDAVLVQAYTCVVVINAITQLGATPIYVDINTDYNMDPVDADKKITLPHVKALIIQHTFGVPADIDTLIALARTHGVPTIEDAAHALGARYKGQLVGTYADIGMYSFGSDKIISCVRGGALSTADAALATRIASVQQALPQPSLLHTLRHLLHIPVFAVGKALYGIGVGKWLLALTKRLHIVNKIVYPAEKRGGFAPSYPSRLANSLAHILTMQLADLDARNAHRMRIAQQYSAGIHNPRITVPPIVPAAAYVRFALQVDNPAALHAYAKSRGIIVGDWYQQVVAPADTDSTCTQYVPGSCPVAESLAQHSINLPTNRFVTVQDAQRIIDVLNSYGS